MKYHRGHWKNSFEALSENKAHQFVVFIRYNDVFNENFSIGLDYNPRFEKGSFTLFRCNRPHGGTLVWEHHDKSQIHIATAEALNNGLRASMKIEATTSFSVSGTDALSYFLQRTNIQGFQEYFNPKQGDLFGDLP